MPPIFFSHTSAAGKWERERERDKGSEKKTCQREKVHFSGMIFFSLTLSLILDSRWLTDSQLYMRRVFFLLAPPRHIWRFRFHCVFLPFAFIYHSLKSFFRFYRCKNSKGYAKSSIDANPYAAADSNDLMRRFCRAVYDDERWTNKERKKKIAQW